MEQFHELEEESHVNVKYEEMENVPRSDLIFNFYKIKPCFLYDKNIDQRIYDSLKTIP